MANRKRRMDKVIPQNKKCWVDGCNNPWIDWPYCKKHFPKKKSVRLKVPGIKGFDNTPTKT